jgi:hypothetical protein
MQVLFNRKVAGYVKKSSIIVKRNNMSKSIRHHTYSSYYQIMLIKHAEQANNCEMARKYSIM